MPLQNQSILSNLLESYGDIVFFILNWKSHSPSVELAPSFPELLWPCPVSLSCITRAMLLLKGNLHNACTPRYGTKPTHCIINMWWASFDLPLTIDTLPLFFNSQYLFVVNKILSWCTCDQPTAQNVSGNNNLSIFLSFSLSTLV